MGRVNLPGDVRDFLVRPLSMVLAAGQGAELTGQRLGAAVTDALARPVEACEITPPNRFALAILAMTDNAAARTAVINGVAAASS